MQSRARIVGIDYGTKRVGIAISDPLHLFAQPLETCRPRDVLNRIAAIMDESGVASIIVGWPANPQDDDATAMAMVQPFIDRLESRFPETMIVKWDERFSSQSAKQALFDAGVSKKARRSKNRVNAAAAAVILQEYLDQLRKV